MSRADRPELVEHVFAMDADDELSVSETTDVLRVVNPPMADGPSSVRNWNAAAAVASGDLLMVIADDLVPPDAWDTTLLAMVASLDPRRVPFAIKVTDSLSEDDRLLRHPVVSRAFYERHGLFSDQYRGVFCDNDITRRAFWRAVILDGRALVLDHQHPLLGRDVPMSESQRRINTQEEARRGRAIYESMWNTRERFASVRMVPPCTGPMLTESRLRWLRRRFGLMESFSYLPRRVGRLAKLSIRPQQLLERLRPTRQAKRDR